MRLHEAVAQDFLANLDFDEQPKRLRIERRRDKYDRRRKHIVVMDGDQILREYWPPNAENEVRARDFLAGYQMAQTVWCPREILTKWKERWNGNQSP